MFLSRVVSRGPHAFSSQVSSIRVRVIGAVCFSPSQQVNHPKRYLDPSLAFFSSQTKRDDDSKITPSSPDQQNPVTATSTSNPSTSTSTSTSTSKSTHELLEEGGIGDTELWTSVHNESAPKKNALNERLEERGIGDKDLGKDVGNIRPDNRKKPYINWLYYDDDVHSPPLFGPGRGGRHVWRFFTTVCGLNLLVFFWWNKVFTEEEAATKKNDLTELARCQRDHDWLTQNFATNLHNLWDGRYWTLLTASYSHQTFAHLSGNMFACALFGWKTYKSLGGMAFTGLYLVGGGVSALAHCGQNWYKRKIDTPLSAAEVSQLKKIPLTAPLSENWQSRLEKADTPSLGASGSVMAIAAAAAMLFPRDRVIALRPLPFFAPLPIAVLIFIASDLIGIHLPDNIDHVGHLAGVLTGISYIIYLWYFRARVFTKDRGHLPLLKHARRRLFGQNVV